MSFWKKAWRAANEPVWPVDARAPGRLWRLTGVGVAAALMVVIGATFVRVTGDAPQSPVSVHYEPGWALGLLGLFATVTIALYIEVLALARRQGRLSHGDRERLAFADNVGLLVATASMAVAVIAVMHPLPSIDLMPGAFIAVAAGLLAAASLETSVVKNRLAPSEPEPVDRLRDRKRRLEALATSWGSSQDTSGPNVPSVEVPLFAPLLLTSMSLATWQPRTIPIALLSWLAAIGARRWVSRAVVRAEPLNVVSAIAFIGLLSVSAALALLLGALAGARGSDVSAWWWVLIASLLLAAAWPGVIAVATFIAAGKHHKWVRPSMAASITAVETETSAALERLTKAPPETHLSSRKPSLWERATGRAYMRNEEGDDD